MSAGAISLHNHPGPREVIAKGMGYSSLNGSSMTAISALHKYGLLEGRGDEIKVSDRARRIMHPESDDELLRNYLLRRNFAPSAVSQVILSYRETKELVQGLVGGYDSPVSITKGHTDMQPQASPGQVLALPPGAGAFQETQGNERSIGRYDFEGGGYVRISAGGDISTEEALEMVETIIKLKQQEIERRKKRTAVAVVPTEKEQGAEENNEQNA